ncbi:hypothetical protein ACQZV8_12780 [Magnetococcales bacterium HHB-1]
MVHLEVRQINQLVPDIKKNAELVQEVSASSTEQNQGADQINQALSQLDETFQSNAGASEEMAATAGQLNEQALDLQNSVAEFNLGSGGHSSSNPRRPTPPASQSSLQLPAPQPSGVRQRGHNGSPAAIAHLDRSDDETFERF